VRCKELSEDLLYSIELRPNRWRVNAYKLPTDL
jgi:hypothetical protein